MNNQFFGDERDFFKYALLRVLAACGLPVGVCWLLTEGARKGGGELAYLRGSALRATDAALFDFLRDCVCVKGHRDVRILEKSGIIPNAKFFSCVFPRGDGREEFFNAMIASFSDRGLVFFDPDTGILLPGQKPGKNNTKDEYVCWNELRHVGERMGETSLMVFQYFYLPWDSEGTRKLNAAKFAELRNVGGNGASVFALWKRPVAYYFVVRPKHKRFLQKGIQRACVNLGFEIHGDSI